MHSRAIPILSIACGIALATYLGLLVAAIAFASIRTDLGAELREAETRVGALETRYYEAIASINNADIASAGLVVPKTVEYVAADGTPTVSRAERRGQ